MHSFIFSSGFFYLFCERFWEYIFKSDYIRKIICKKKQYLDFNIFKIYMYDEFSFTCVRNTIFYDEYWLCRIYQDLLKENKENYVSIYNVWANIGDFIIFSKLYFPNSKIYWYEINPQIMNTLKKNIEENNIKNTHLLNIWISREDSLLLIDTNKSSWSVNTTKKWGTKVKCIPLYKMTNEKITILEMDIEWEEFEIFKDSNNLNFLENVNYFLIEHHDNEKWKMLKEKIIQKWFDLFYVSENNPYTFVFKKSI